MQAGPITEWEAGALNSLIEALTDHVPEYSLLAAYVDGQLPNDAYVGIEEAIRHSEIAQVFLEDLLLEVEYPEERRAHHFLQTLVQGRKAQAHETTNDTDGDAAMREEELNLKGRQEVCSPVQASVASQRQPPLNPLFTLPDEDYERLLERGRKADMETLRED